VKKKAKEEPASGLAGGPVGALGEFGLIRGLVGELGDAAAEILLPEGDDAAVWDPGGPALVTTDALTEGVHFRADWTSPEDLGFKAISVNVSDIAAMGGRPSLALVALGTGADTKAKWAAGLYRGLADACRHYGLKIGGGDTFRMEKVTIVITALGVPPPGGPVGRSGASEGDILYVTGELGEAAAGLAYLKARQLEGRLKGKTRKSGRGKVEEEMAGAVSRFLRPVARVAEGEAAAAAGASAMIDISDGLAGDAGHLGSASGVGVVIHAAALPIGGGALTAERMLGETPKRLALSGGEDYELLISVPPGKSKELESAVASTGTKITAVGEVVAVESGCKLENEGATMDLSGLGGYDHFKV
jgi:thiamine-monophosphate kinase